MAITFLKKQHYQEDISQFIIKFDGDSDIDAETLSIVLSNIAEMIKAITAEIEPNAYAKLTIKSTKEGSFEVDLATIISYLPTLFGATVATGGLLTIASLCTRTFKDILDIKKHLKGAKPEKIEKKGETTTIKNCDGDKLSVNSRADIYFQNPKFDNCTVNIFNTLDSDTKRVDFHLIQEGEKQLTIKKEEYSRMAVSVMQEANNQITTIQEKTEANVFVKKPDFRGTSKWELMFLGKPIKAEIKDTDWLKKVHAGDVTGFGAKVTIPVIMIIEYDVDINNDPIANTHKYTVLKVTGNIILPSENKDLFK